MIKEVKMVTVICDNCKTNAFEGDEITAWNDEDYAVDCAIESGFIKDGDNHYCSDCYSIDEIDDITVDPSRYKEEDDE